MEWSTPLAVKTTPKQSRDQSFQRRSYGASSGRLAEDQVDIAALRECSQSLLGSSTLFALLMHSRLPSKARLDAGSYLAGSSVVRLKGLLLVARPAFSECVYDTICCI